MKLIRIAIEPIKEFLTEFKSVLSERKKNKKNENGGPLKMDSERKKMFFKYALIAIFLFLISFIFILLPTPNMYS